MEKFLHDKYFDDGYHYYTHDGIDPEAIVISGVSGRFPECESVGEYMDAVYNKRPLILFSDERFAKNAFKNPYPSCGLLKNIDKVDSDFFCLTHAAANGLDPASRIHQEVAYECIFDSGYNPDELKGANIGVYNATTADDGMKIDMENRNEMTLHCIRTMNPNRASYIMDLTGPSHTYDSACSSSAVAFHSAVNDLKSGRVDAAIASGCQLNLDPEKTTAYFLAGVASLEGNSKPYDAESDGMLRTEGIAAVFLQKAKHARRIYSVVMGSKYRCAGYVPEGISVPSRSMQVYTLGTLLKENGVHPNQIQYVEGHGTGTQVGDPIEINAMADLFLKEEHKREKPLYLGSSKSNIGHTESTSGIMGLINALFAFHTGQIPPNIRYNNPNPRGLPLVEGKIKVPKEPVPLESPYIPVNSFGFGGTIVECLLKQGPLGEKEKKERKVPKLLLYAGTTEEAIEHFFDYIKTHEDEGDAFYAMVNKLAFTPPISKPYRGYSVFYDNNNLVTQSQIVSSEKRQVWFIMTGMGCQWAGMGLQLMSIDVFARSMNKSAELLKDLGIDLFELLREDKDYLAQDRRILPAFVCISSIQIGLVDLMKHVEIEPDGIIGHSTGEIICAYADGCCTHEETIMSAYYRGICVEAGDLVRGSMAAVGLSWEEAEKRCPAGIFPACDNSADSVTISGLQEPVDKFVKQLKQENIFARVVNAYGYAFHSKYVHAIAGSLRENLGKMMTNPKKRTPRWVSTSYPEDEWKLEAAKVADADYFVHNLMSPVRFTSGIKKIPPNAITIEIGPHHLLQSILKRGCGSETSHIGLMKRNHEDNVQFFFDALGKMYNEGLDPKLERMYPPVKFPVPKGSPMLSNLIKWNHSVSFRVPKYVPRSGPCMIDIRLDKGDRYLLDHKIDGRSLFPATGYIWLVWEVFAFRTHKKLDETPIIIENFKIHRATVLTSQADVQLTTAILTGTGYFEIKESGQLVASGFVREEKEMTYHEKPPTYKSEEKAVSGADLYNELKMAGYEYGPQFQSLIEMAMDGQSGLITWRNKWIPFLDCMLLFFGIIEKRHKFFLPTGARSVKLDPMAFRKFISKKVDESGDPTIQYEEDTVPVTYNPRTRICRSVGIEIKGLEVDSASLRASTDIPTTEEYKFVPYISTYTPDDQEKITELSQYMGMCNKLMKKVKKDSKSNVPLTEFPDCPIEENYEEYFTRTESDDWVLLNQLTNLSNDVSQIKNQSKLPAFTKDLGMDTLNSVLVNTDVLRGLMDLIMENNPKKLSVMELNQNFPLVLPTLMKMTTKHPHLKYKRTTMVVPTIENVDQEVVSKHNIQLLEGSDLASLGLSKKEDILISSFTNGSEADLHKLIASLKAVMETNGFVILYIKEKLSAGEKFVCSLCNIDPQLRSQTDLLKAVQKENLTVLSKVSDPLGGGAVYLLRSAGVPEHPDKVIHIKEGTFAWVDEVKETLYGEASGDGRVWLVSQDSPISGIVGLITCLKQEPKGDRIRCVFMCQNPTESKFPTFDLANPLYKPLSERNLIMNVWKDGAWGSYRHVLIKEHKIPQLKDNCYVYVYKSGDFSSLKWTESPAKCISSSDHRTLVHVYYSALNFKDVMLASGKIVVADEGTFDNAVNDSMIGLEFSGRDSKGRRVFGFSGGSGICTTLMAGTQYVHEVPDKWSLEDAATVPIVYGTCYYALIARGKLSKGESILIHSGTGGIGIAAIRIALSLGCEIYTTVGTEEKRAYLKKLFPQIKDENIGSSRNLSFEKMVMDGTNGVGVDVVLNSLADEKFKASLRCVARFGRFIEIGKYDLLQDTRIGLRWFEEDRQFHGIALDKIFDMTDKSNKISNMMWNLVKDGMEKGVVQPLDRISYQWDQVEDAFRFMGKGLHMGKILIKMRDEEKSKVLVPKPLSLPVIPKTFFYDKKVYIIVGGLGGFGIEVTNWMVIRGARKIILTSRFGARTPYHFLCLQRWKRELVDVKVSLLNVAKRDEAEKLIKEALKMGPIGGIFNSAVVLKDAFMDSQTIEDFKEVCDPKGTATKYLDTLTRVMCPDLDYFVCFSSVSCGRGNAGQTNYGFANSQMERICEERKRAGLHGLSIQWGIIGGVGVVHRHMGDDAMIAGVIAQNAKSCLATLDDFLQEKAPVVSSYMTVVERKTLGQGDVLAQLGKILGMSVDQINPTRSFGTMGIDSMVGVELKQLLDSNCGLNLTIQEIQDMKIGDVKDMLEKVEADKSTGTGARGIGQGLMATTNLKLPPNLINDVGRFNLNPLNLGEPIFFLKLGDEIVSDLNELLTLIDRPVGLLQWHHSYNTTDIESFAKSLCMGMESMHFDLVSFTISANVALEVALVSQKCKSLTLINGSDVLVRKLNPEDNEEEDQELTLLCRFVEQFGIVDTYRLKEELKKAPNLDQRIKTLAQFMEPISSRAIDKNELTAAVQEYIAKTRLVESFNPKEKLPIDINIIEDPMKVLPNDVTKIKEAFSKVVTGKVNVHRICSMKDLSNLDEAAKVADVIYANI